VIDGFLSDLESRLEALGVRGASLRRVLAEARDHPEEAAQHGADTVRRFGDPEDVARQIASEIATARTCRATFATFGALAVAGLAYVGVFALVPTAGGWPDFFSGRVPVIGPLAAIAAVLLPQVAFVSGCLALIRALRLRPTAFVGREELSLLRRRSNVALAATSGSLASLVALALNDHGEFAAWWTWSAIALCAVLAVPLIGAAYVVSDSACPAAPSLGPAGDVFDDLGPVLRIEPLRRLELSRHPSWFALVSAIAVGFLGFAGGWYAEGDPGSGIVRGVFEAVALLVCFAALGAILGLRRTKR
jgi:uncharacterized membrane protein